ncbi:DUF1684 domain-containing protein [Acidicapsa dinghuensis]|uniref:DUF1684 domain-containing protein n=1 Tax=Acidicapsa dinghuensis TaxID=2218256 RepID=A0ABW1EJC5_9BACT|nr:DUF1684 domain-containing protein [Acidicapsa dinghuensis]
MTPIDSTTLPAPLQGRNLVKRLFSGLLTGLVCCGTIIAHAASATDSADLRADQQWRVDRAKNLSAPDGWLTLVGLEWLKPGANSLGGAADNTIRLKGHAPEHLGIIQVDGSQLKLLPPTGGFPKELTLDGAPAHESPLASDDGRPSSLATNNLHLVVLHRGERFALRIKDSDSPTRTNFRGLHWYPIEAKYRITAKWLPFNPPHTEQIPTVIGTVLNLQAPGLAEFTLNGKTVQVEPVLESPNSKELFFILRDATSHTTTYQASRFLYAEFPSNGLDKPGTIVLDFNRLQNPPCAYTPYATCPLPPYINRLAIAIPAGEERYTH